MSSRDPINMLDEKDAELFRKREEAWMARKGPRVGDYALIYGQYRRFTHDWEESGMQTTSGPHLGSASYHIDRRGYAEYSGALDPCVSRERIKDSLKVKPGSFWFFHHDQPRAHNGISCELPCRIYEIAPEPKEIWLDRVNGHLFHHYNTTLGILGIEITDEWEKEYPWDYAMRIADERQLEQRWGEVGSKRKGAIRW